MIKIPPNFLFPTNFRNGKNIKRLIKDFSVQGYGVAVYLLETLAETDGHKYPLSDVDLLSDEMKVSVPVIQTIITSYELFEFIENDEGVIFISSKLNEWLEPYYNKVEKLKRAGKISALKKKKEQERLIKELSELDSSQHMLNICSTINKSINKQISKNLKNESEIWREWNENQIKKAMYISKLEEQNIACRKNQIEI
ncbi:Lin1244/Lin1753 domain-containing protein [Aliarcobacter cryaerophilus]|uniref:Lin1244/Lin1753 domain-containing protein n=1 Tax=Aliarcobacter cryaerophilus TaxID=28198 RepID=UPI00112F3506|nr:Lin1244/Lin1753 domain-containing protein [Aliarcobacter cryaerophilus]